MAKKYINKSGLKGLKIRFKNQRATNRRMPCIELNESYRKFNSDQKWVYFFPLRSFYKKWTSRFRPSTTCLKDNLNFIPYKNSILYQGWYTWVKLTRRTRFTQESVFIIFNEGLGAKFGANRFRWDILVSSRWTVQQRFHQFQ